jgi:hypothetical protein
VLEAAAADSAPAMRIDFFRLLHFDQSQLLIRISRRDLA